jgi:hypothetical protein
MNFCECGNDIFWIHIKTVHTCGDHITKASWLNYSTPTHKDNNCADFKNVKYGYKLGSFRFMDPR